MKIEFHIKGVIITSKQKSMMQKKLLKMKRYLHDEPMTLDLSLLDESGPEKGGIDQRVNINATFGKEKIFIEEVDDRLMRAFAFAIKRFERQLQRYHKKRIQDTHHGGGGRLDKIWKVVRRKKK